MVPPLVLLVLLPLMACCRLSEFACQNGRCVPSARFCDGSDDCGDLSDEPHHCTNCNRTFYAESNVKLPLRMSSPYNRPLPFVCSMDFVAGGGRLIQLTFLSFQIGALDVDNSSSPRCLKGHLQMVEPPALPNALLRQQTRGFSQLLSALKAPSDHLSALFDASRPEFGRFCGDMIGKSATFYSEGSNVTLRAVVPSLHPFSLYLTYKYLAREEAPLPHLGSKVSSSYCDRVLVNCDRKRCAVRSPNFPGFYLRNMTCHFWIRQEAVPRGRRASIVLAQANEYKISLHTGRSSPLSHAALSEECRGDVVRIYDGPTTDSPLLLQFCGAGPLSEVVSSSSEVLVQLYSSPSQVLHGSFVELDVEVRFSEASEFRVREGRCDFSIDGAQHRSGLVYSPRHTLPKNSSCSFRLQGAGAHDRVWLYFLSYYVEDRHPWSRRESCEVGRLELHEGRKPWHRFCEKTLPKVCARASDDPGYIPVRPCRVPDESYLSRGPGLLIEHRATSASSSSFTLRYEFVDTRQQGAPVGSGPCDRRFDGRTDGTVASPRNVFLFGRGGRPNISCTYEFVGLPSERLLLTFTEIRLRSGDCEHHYDSLVQRHGCRAAAGGGAAARGSAAVSVVEKTAANVQSALACFCGIRTEPRRPVVIESVTNHVTIDFSVTDMSPFDDFQDFGFEAVYEFLPISLCQAGIRRENDSSEGEVVFRVPPTVEGRAMPLRCRWLLEAAPHQYLYLRFEGTDDCQTGNKIIVYSSLPLSPLSVVCSGQRSSISGAESASSSAVGHHSTRAVFSDHWYNETADPRILRDHLYIEVLASQADTVRFEWMEVTKRRECAHQCPELNACIPARLWCDGRAHCPSGCDEAHCHTLPTPYLAAGGLLLLLLLLLLALCTLRCRTHSKEPTFPIDSPPRLR